MSKEGFFDRYGWIAGPLTVVGVILWLSYYLISDLNESNERRATHAKAQCNVLLERSRTYEDTTNTLKHVVNGGECIYWTTMEK